ncbi:hypothetical protein H632_c115p0 [Helicosporidium sp. ATCC 50920]|nr:hypothetical protein H632_c115p0 [Helicosporidium sp. ATCC 50920]|eukprot:KDD76758.1 hypothetical protein H632_c115p0 [Helicosporidium sp. ATCC 50920]
MDGTVAVLDAEDGGRVLGARRAHAKYVVALAWVGSWGLVSGAWDQKAALSCLAERTREQGPGEDAVDEATPFELRPGFQASFGGRVEDVLCTRVDSIPGQSGSAGRVCEIAVAVRGSAHLYLLSFSDLSAPLVPAGLTPPAQPRISHLSTRLLSANEARDDHASFTIARLGLFDPGNLSNAAGACSRPLLNASPGLPGPLWVLATDAGSVILFDPETSAHVRTLTGLALGPFHAHALGVFGREALAVAAGEGGTLHAWRVASGEALPPLRAHSPAAVRALCVDPDSGTLFTASFDRSLKVFCVDPRGSPDAA